jgi:hydroxymethylglutaryl-CoA synthase
MGMSGNAIEAVGVYTPRYRIDADAFDTIGGFEARGVNSKSVAAGDEDSTTMAVEAVRKALSGAETDRDTVAELVVATTTPPVEEFDFSATVAEILGLSPDVRTTVHSQSTSAGTRALSGGFSADGPAIVVAADHPQSSPTDRIDHAAGAGAVAFVLSSEGTVEVRESTTYTEEYPGTRFRQFGSSSVETYDATAYERRAFTEPIAAAVGELRDPAEAVAISAPNGSLPYRAASQFGFDADVYQAASDLGDLGAASALVSLVRAWNDDADRVTVVGYGDGASVDALVLEGRITASMDRTTERIEYGEYLRKRGHIASTTGGDN